MTTSALCPSKPKKRRKETPQEFFKRNQIKEQLIKQWNVDGKVANSFARKHVSYPLESIQRSIIKLVDYFKHLHQCHYGYKIDKQVLSGALSHSIRRLSRSQKPLSEKQLSYFLQLAKDEVASKMTTCYDPGTAPERERVMSPLKQALVYEEDEAMRKRLLFIYTLFVQQGLRLAKINVIQACTSDQILFPHRRVVEDAIETLRGAYEALGFLKGELFITPEYLSIS